jgi:hypothetical protein
LLSRFLRNKELSMTRTEREAWLAPVLAASSIDAIEAAFYVCTHTDDGRYNDLPEPLWRALEAAVETSGWALVNLDPMGAWVPRIVKKPHSFRGTTFLGHRFPSGVWGNGPGYRWVYADLVYWVQQVGKFPDPKTARLLIEWVIYGMPHRALRAVYNTPSICQTHEEGKI